MANLQSILCIALAVGPVLAGCTAQSDPALRLVFTQPDDTASPAAKPSRLSHQIELASGRPTVTYYVNENEMVLQTVHAGQADAAIVDTASAWYGWQTYNLSVAAAQVEPDGRPYYVVSAWVLANSTYQSMADLRDARGCFTGLINSETFLVLGWMLDKNLVAVVGSPNEVASIQPTISSYFGYARIPRSESDPYGDYRGALRCLSDGLGDVAFVKDTTPRTYCSAGMNNSWCLPLGSYRKIQDFGAVPSHPVVVGDIPLEKREDLVGALVALSTNDDGRSVLFDVLGTRRIVAINSTQEYLGSYAALLAKIPGMTTIEGMKTLFTNEAHEGTEKGNESPGEAGANGPHGGS